MIKSINSLRFILALIIVYCHYFSYELQKTNLFTDVEMVNRIHPKVSNAFLVVEMFFIISGFFLYKTYKNHKDFIAFVKSKITRLWPGLFISTISLILLGWTSPIFQTNKYSELLNLLFCQANGLSLDWHFVNWYISSLFWCSIFYFYIIKNFDKKISNIIIALFTFGSYVILVQKGLFGARIDLHGIFINAMLRGFAGIGLGYFIGILFEKYKSQSPENLNKKEKVKQFVIYSAIEVYTFIFLINNLIFHKLNYPNKFVYIVYFVALFWCLLMDKGIISRLLSLNFLSSAGKYSYTIYVLHEPITWGLITPFLWTPLAAICHTHPAAMLILIPISIVILISALVYKFLETPLKSCLKQRFEDIKWLV